MIFTETELSGAFLVDVERLEDDRGFFARTFCRDEFAARGLAQVFPQCNTSYNRRRGTLRGMHFQASPHEEAKLVRCTRGALLDVIVDLREGSPTRLRWVAVELTEQSRRALYIPRGFAHGFQTLLDETEVFYQMSEAFVPGAGRGLRWDDPRLGIRWPLPDPILSPRDASYALIDDR